MFRQFQKGDQVKVVKDFSGGERFIGETGLVVNDLFTGELAVELEDGLIVHADPEELKLLEVAHKSTMGNLTILAKKIVDADLRNMIKVGWLDSGLNLTSEGEDVVLADYLSENKAKFGKLAEDELKEQRKDREGK